MKDLPFTGMAVFKPWANAHVEIVKRVLAATDASIAWFADPAHRSEAVELLVQTAHSTKEDAAASYDLLPPYRLFRADQQSLAGQAAEPDQRGAARRQYRADADG